MQDKWNQFVYDLCEAKKNGVDESRYHSMIEMQLQLLGWAKYRNEICHKANLSIGSNGFIQPDILVQKEDEKLFVIEVKRPLHTQIPRDCDQLVSYMRQLKLNVGIYIGEKIEIFYDKTDCENPVSVLTVPLELDNEQGIRFVKLFNKDGFSKEAIVKFCEERLDEKRRQEKLDEFRELLISDSQKQITDALKVYIKGKYGNVFLEDSVDEMLSSLIFTVESRAIQLQPTIASAPVVASPMLGTDVVKPKKQYDNTKFSINGGYPLFKNRFVYQIVKMYVAEHPTKSFAEIEQVFKPEYQGSMGVIRTIDYIRSKGYKDAKSRYFMGKDEVLYDSCGVSFVVCTQWKIDSVTNIVNLARRLGYNVSASE